MRAEMNSAEGQARDLSTRLLDLVEALVLAEDLDGTLGVLTKSALGLVACDGISVMWLGEDHLKVLASAGATAAPPGLMLPTAQMGAARPVLDGGRPVLIPDTAHDVRWQRIPGEESVRSWLGVPLVLEQRTLGLLEWTAREPNRFGETDVAMAVGVARYVAPVLHRAQLMDDMRRRMRQLAELPRAQARALDPADGLAATVSTARQATGAEHAFIFLGLGEDGLLRCVSASGEQQAHLLSTVLRGDGTLPGWPSSGTFAGQPRVGASDRDVLAALGIHNALIFPLRVRGEPVGLLGVAEYGEETGLSQAVLRTLTDLSAQASSLLEQTHLSRSRPEQHDYEMIVQSAPLAMAVLTQSGSIRFSNPGLAELLARPRAKLVGRNLSEFVLTSDRKRLSHTMDEVAVMGQRRQLDVSLRALGEQRHVRISLARVSADPAADLVAILEDVTSVKILERERVEHLRELREQHNLLTQLDLLKSRFVSNVSHEFRTPLAVIKLYATLARRGRPEKQPHYLQMIEQEVHRLETMVENVLDLTRIDRQALQVHCEMLQPEPIIEQVLEVYGETARRKGIGLTNAVHGPLPLLWADRSHLVQMLTNLVDNALRYTPRGGQVWVASQRVVVDGRPMLELSVGDTGTGIPEDEQQKVFERFYRGSNNAAGSTGTGLGLAIVAELMGHHGGKVHLRSRVGEGSIFALQFPLPAQGAPPGA